MNCQFSVTFINTIHFYTVLNLMKDFCVVFRTVVNILVVNVCLEKSRVNY